MKIIDNKFGFINYINMHMKRYDLTNTFTDKKEDNAVGKELMKDLQNFLKN